MSQLLQRTRGQKATNPKNVKGPTPIRNVQSKGGKFTSKLAERAHMKGRMGTR